MFSTSFTVADEQMRVGYRKQPENLILSVTFLNALFEVSLNTQVLRTVWRPTQNKVFQDDTSVLFRVTTEMAASASHKGIYETE